MMKTRKIRRRSGAPRHQEASSRAMARFGLGITALTAAATLSFTVPAMSVATAGAAGQGPHPVRTVILIGTGPGSTGPTPRATPTPVLSPTAGETGCCA